MITIVLVDDRPPVRRGLRMILGLEPDVTVVGEAGDGAAALELVLALVPDVIVMDIEMSGMDGISATRVLHAIAPQSAVVVLTLYDDCANRDRARAAGATAFVAKHEAGRTLVPAIRCAAATDGI